MAEHTEHCLKRQKWGDGECECGAKGSSAPPNCWAAATHDQSDGAGYCRGCGTTIGEEHHSDCEFVAVDTAMLRKGFGSALGRASQIAAYHRALVVCCEEIDRLRKKLPPNDRISGPSKL